MEWILSEAQRLAGELDNSWAYVTLGGALSEIKQRRAFKELGHKTFQEYVESVLGFSSRKASNLMRVAAITKNLKSQNGIDEEALKKISFSKLVMIARFIEQDPVKGRQWLTQAAGMSVSKLKAAIEADGGADATEMPRPWTVRLFAGQRERIEAALEIAKKKTGSDNPGFCLEMLAAEFIATYEGEAQDGG